MRNLLRSQRGSAAFATVIALVPLIGAVGLGAEAASWYVTRQQGQNAADAAAYAGALRLSCDIAGAGNCGTSVDTQSRVFAAQNAFCNTGDSYSGCVSLPSQVARTVQVDIGNFSAGSFTTPAAGTGNAVRVRVSQQQPAYLVAVLGLGGPVNIPAQAIAMVQNPSKVCGLALGPDPNGGGALKIGGNVSNNGTGCPLMSDSSVQFASTPSFTGSGWGVYSATGCSPTSTCGSVSATHNYFMPSAMDPLQGLQTASFNTRTSPSTKPCGGNVTNGQTCSLTPNSASGVYSDLKVNAGGTVNFAAGTYFFYNATITFGGTVNGTDVTLVLLGNSSLTINGGTVNLAAPTTNTFSSTLNGVLIDDQSTAAVSIGGNGVIKLAGAMYFPKADVSFGGTSQPTNTTCSEVIAKTLTMTGTPYLSTDSCAPSTIAYTQVVALVQ
ncbi:pilus assembly protein TadG-related protein [Bradyrhizobium sp. Gha]|uniref:pilus assembly protein TadG-related protein n=1 Tax=Bradyrhizobium sp. Gha TaxID=1855318 RepID=UPI0008E1D012|nr:pilus assembly protein TadG-related protein [Bradyrhizobium sp. Gha]SFI16799.1 Flp pilus assembly protein TadG [Bradyrhizobium sp. Gha]